MDAIFKVCDVMENMSLTAATVAPKCFTCGPDTSMDGSIVDRSYDKGCGKFSAKFASHDMGYNVDDNSVCTYSYNDDTESDINVETRRKKGHYMPTKRNSGYHPWSEDDDTFNTRKSSWASIDGRPPRRRSFPNAYSLSRQELPSRRSMGFRHEATDDDYTNRTYETYESTIRTYETCDEESNQSSAIKQTEEADNRKFDNFRLDKIGLDLFGLPLHWTRVVKKKSSWSSSSHKTPSATSTDSSGSYDDGSTDRSRNRRDDYNSLEAKNSLKHSPGSHPPEVLKNPAGFKNSLSYSSSMNRELPSFGKSREFRSFGSNRSNPSLDSMASFYSLKPTYMTPRESKQMDEESSRYRYIIPTPSSDRSSTASSNTQMGPSIKVISALPPEMEPPMELHHNEFDHEFGTTTIPYSSLAR